mmetsp:Transcript_3201/g.7582  ORF Transcript_3201/g.7582 Transcript_3201/m.7582 type:complete len:218 (-) Transcript_3201:95-748(-)
MRCSSGGFNPIVCVVCAWSLCDNNNDDTSSRTRNQILWPSKPEAQPIGISTIQVISYQEFFSNKTKMVLIQFLCRHVRDLGFERHGIASFVLHSLKDALDQVFSNPLAPMRLADGEHANVPRERALYCCRVVLLRGVFGIDLAHNTPTDFSRIGISCQDTQIGKSIEKIPIGKNAVGLRQVAGNQSIDVLQPAFVLVVHKDDGIASRILHFCHYYSD